MRKMLLSSNFRKVAEISWCNNEKLGTYVEIRKIPTNRPRRLHGCSREPLPEYSCSSQSSATSCGKIQNFLGAATV